MPYATSSAVQDRIPLQLWEAAPDSQPGLSVVEEWLAADTRFVEAALRWKYLVPVTDAEDLALLAPIVAALTAARVWTVVAAQGGQPTPAGDGMRREALQMLAYSASTGR